MALGNNLAARQGLVSAQSSETISDGWVQITPRVIDFKDYIIQMGQVASVRIDGVKPYLMAGVLSIIMGIFLLMTAGRQYDGPTQFLMAIFGVFFLIGGAILLNFTREFLLIATSDGRRLQIQAKRKFLEAMLDRIRDAMTFEPDRDIRYSFNLNAETIEIGTLLDQSSASNINSPGASAVAGDVGGKTAGKSSARTSANGYANGAGYADGSGYANGSGYTNGADSGAAPGPANVHMSRSGANGADGHGRTTYTFDFGGASSSTPPTGGRGAERGTTDGRSGGQRTASNVNAPGGIAVAGDISNARLSTSVEMVAAAEIGQLIALIERRDVAHKADLMRLLDAVNRHLAAGPKGRAEAQSTWRSFADYAVKYLGHIDGVLGMVERIGRILT
jgi:hypothetical protein